VEAEGPVIGRIKPILMVSCAIEAPVTVKVAARPKAAETASDPKQRREYWLTESMDVSPSDMFDIRTL
jgi:hypothetical protein